MKLKAGIIFLSGYVFNPLFVPALFSQSVSPSVYCSAGAFASPGWGSLSYSVGEAVTTTLSGSTILTQGFHQPLRINQLRVSASAKNVSCNGARDGYAAVTVLSGMPPYSFSWSPAVSSKDSAFSLQPGTYIITVSDSTGETASDTVHIANSPVTCSSDVLHIYNGITPNGDSHNDQWVIDGIRLFPENTVQVFNRWGNKVWEGTGYNNTSIVWEGKDEKGRELTDGTYFYVVILNDKQYTGWVELTR